MAQQSFSASVDAWVQETEARMVAVFRTAAQYVIEDVILRTPVDTGFLRASLTVTKDAPTPMSKSSGAAIAQPYALTINGARIGDSIYASFVANYAGHVEYGARGRPGVGMVRLAAQKWPAHVERAVRAAKARAAANTRSN